MADLGVYLFRLGGVGTSFWLLENHRPPRFAPTAPFGGKRKAFTVDCSASSGRYPPPRYLFGLKQPRIMTCLSHPGGSFPSKKNRMDPRGVVHGFLPGGALKIIKKLWVCEFPLPPSSCCQKTSHRVQRIRKPTSSPPSFCLEIFVQRVSAVKTCRSWLFRFCLPREQS